jgi:hypothetical protein
MLGEDPQQMSEKMIFACINISMVLWYISHANYHSISQLSSVY